MTALEGWNKSDAFFGIQVPVSDTTDEAETLKGHVRRVFEKKMLAKKHELGSDVRKVLMADIDLTLIDKHSDGLFSGIVNSLIGNKDKAGIEVNKGAIQSALDDPSLETADKGPLQELKSSLAQIKCYKGLLMDDKDREKLVEILKKLSPEGKKIFNEAFNASVRNNVKLSDNCKKFGFASSTITLTQALQIVSDDFKKEIPTIGDDFGEALSQDSPLVEAFKRSLSPNMLAMVKSAKDNGFEVYALSHTKASLVIKLGLEEYGVTVKAKACNSWGLNSEKTPQMNALRADLAKENPGKSVFVAYVDDSPTVTKNAQKTFRYAADKELIGASSFLDSVQVIQSAVTSEENRKNAIKGTVIQSVKIGLDLLSKDPSEAIKALTGEKVTSKFGILNRLHNPDKVPNNDLLGFGGTGFNQFHTMLALMNLGEDGFYKLVPSDQQMLVHHYVHMAAENVAKRIDEILWEEQLRSKAERAATNMLENFGQEKDAFRQFCTTVTSKEERFFSAQETVDAFVQAIGSIKNSDLKPYNTECNKLDGKPWEKLGEEPFRDSNNPIIQRLRLGMASLHGTPGEFNQLKLVKSLIDAGYTSESIKKKLCSSKNKAVNDFINNYIRMAAQRFNTLGEAALREGVKSHFDLQDMQMAEQISLSVKKFSGKFFGVDQSVSAAISPLSHKSSSPTVLAKAASLISTEEAKKTVQTTVAHVQSELMALSNVAIKAIPELLDKDVTEKHGILSRYSQPKPLKRFADTGFNQFHTILALMKLGEDGFYEHFASLTPDQKMLVHHYVHMAADSVEKGIDDILLEELSRSKDERAATNMLENFGVEQYTLKSFCTTLISKEDRFCSGWNKDDNVSIIQLLDGGNKALAKRGKQVAAEKAKAILSPDGDDVKVLWVDIDYTMLSEHTDSKISSIVRAVMYVMSDFQNYTESEKSNLLTIKKYTHVDYLGKKKLMTDEERAKFIKALNELPSGTKDDLTKNFSDKMNVDISLCQALQMACDDTSEPSGCQLKGFGKPLSESCELVQYVKDSIDPSMEDLVQWAKSENVEVYAISHTKGMPVIHHALKKLGVIVTAGACNSKGVSGIQNKQLQANVLRRKHPDKNVRVVNMDDSKGVTKDMKSYLSKCTEVDLTERVDLTKRGDITFKTSAPTALSQLTLQSYQTAIQGLMDLVKEPSIDMFRALADLKKKAQGEKFKSFEQYISRKLQRYQTQDGDFNQFNVMRAINHDPEGLVAAMVSNKLSVSQIALVHHYIHMAAGIGEGIIAESLNEKDPTVADSLKESGITAQDMESFCKKSMDSVEKIAATLSPPEMKLRQMINDLSLYSSMNAELFNFNDDVGNMDLELKAQASNEVINKLSRFASSEYIRDFSQLEVLFCLMQGDTPDIIKGRFGLSEGMPVTRFLKQYIWKAGRNLRKMSDLALQDLISDQFGDRATVQGMKDFCLRIPYPSLTVANEPKETEVKFSSEVLGGLLDEYGLSGLKVNDKSWNQLQPTAEKGMSQEKLFNRLLTCHKYGLEHKAVGLYILKASTTFDEKMRELDAPESIKKHKLTEDEKEQLEQLLGVGRAEEKLKDQGFSPLSNDEGVFLSNTDYNVFKQVLQHHSKKGQVGPSQVTLQKVAASGGGGYEIEPSSDATIHCPERILKEFQSLLSGSKILGSKVYNPYTQEYEIIPQDASQLTARHLQMLARNEDTNVDGIVKEYLYARLLTSDQIATLRALVKYSVVTAKVPYTHYGGYHSERKLVPAGSSAIIIDQAGLQWQGDHRNTGGMFFYQDVKPSEKEWAEKTFKQIYGYDRPELSDNKLETTWNEISGHVDLNLVAMAIAAEFTQALYAASSCEPENNKQILFRYLKAGMGFFAEGIAAQNSDAAKKLASARLNGIIIALKAIKNLPDSNRVTLLQNIGAIDLPFSGEGEHVLDVIEKLAEIEVLVKDLELEYKGHGTTDALDNPDSEKYTLATTNCADPHACTGNEGGVASVDAAVFSNLGGGKMVLNATANTTIGQNTVPVSHLDKSVAGIKNSTPNFTEVEPGVSLDPGAMGDPEDKTSLMHTLYNPSFATFDLDDCLLQFHANNEAKIKNVSLDSWKRMMGMEQQVVVYANDYDWGSEQGEIEAVTLTAGDIANLKTLADEYGQDSVTWLQAYQNIIKGLLKAKGKVLGDFNFESPGTMDEDSSYIGGQDLDLSGVLFTKSDAGHEDRLQLSQALIKIEKLREKLGGENCSKDDIGLNQEMLEDIQGTIGELNKTIETARAICAKPDFKSCLDALAKEDRLFLYKLQLLCGYGVEDKQGNIPVVNALHKESGGKVILKGNKTVVGGVSNYYNEGLVTALYHRLENNKYTAILSHNHSSSAAYAFVKDALKRVYMAQKPGDTGFDAWFETKIKSGIFTCSATTVRTTSANEFSGRNKVSHLLAYLNEVIPKMIKMNPELSEDDIKGYIKGLMHIDDSKENEFTEGVLNDIAKSPGIQKAIQDAKAQQVLYTELSSKYPGGMASERAKIWGNSICTQAVKLGRTEAAFEEMLKIAPKDKAAFRLFVGLDTKYPGGMTSTGAIKWGGSLCTQAVGLGLNDTVFARILDAAPFAGTQETTTQKKKKFREYVVKRLTHAENDQVANVFQRVHFDHFPSEVSEGDNNSIDLLFKNGHKQKKQTVQLPDGVDKGAMINAIEKRIDHNTEKVDLSSDGARKLYQVVNKKSPNALRGKDNQSSPDKLKAALRALGLCRDGIIRFKSDGYVLNISEAEHSRLQKVLRIHLYENVSLPNRPQSAEIRAKRGVEAAKCKKYLKQIEALEAGSSVSKASPH